MCVFIFLLLVWQVNITLGESPVSRALKSAGKGHTHIHTNTEQTMRVDVFVVQHMATLSRHGESRSLRVSNSSLMNAHPHAHSPFKTKEHILPQARIVLKNYFLLRM